MRRERRILFADCQFEGFQPVNHYKSVLLNKSNLTGRSCLYEQSKGKRRRKATTNLEMKLDGMARVTILSPDARIEDSPDLHFGGFRQIHEVEIGLDARIDGDATHSSNAHT